MADDKDIFSFPSSKEAAVATIAAIVDVEFKAQSKKNKDIKREDVAAQMDKQFKKSSGEEALMSYATKGRLTEIPEHASELDNNVEATNIGAVLLQIEKAQQGADHKHPSHNVVGNDNKTYNLEPKELSAWLQANAGRLNGDIAINDWARDNSVSLTGHGTEIANGPNETILIETKEGQKRAVGNGMLSERMQGGSYGGIKGTVSGDGDLVDAYVSNDALKDMQAGKTVEGPVVVMQQMDKGKPDELKVGIGMKDAAQMHDIQASSWKHHDDFTRMNEGQYAVLTQAQYKELKQEIATNPELTLENFAKPKGIPLMDKEKVIEQSKDAPNKEATKKVGDLSPEALKELGQIFKEFNKAMDLTNYKGKTVEDVKEIPRIPPSGREH